MSYFIIMIRPTWVARHLCADLLVLSMLESLWCFPGSPGREQSESLGHLFCGKALGLFAETAACNFRKLFLRRNYFLWEFVARGPWHNSFLRRWRASKRRRKKCIRSSGKYTPYQDRCCVPVKKKETLVQKSPVCQEQDDTLIRSFEDTRKENNVLKLKENDC